MTHLLGYRLGFALAALVAAGFGVAAFGFVAVNRLTPPTDLLTITAAYGPLTTEVPASAVYATTRPAATRPTSPAADARTAYRQAIDAVRADPARYAALEAGTDAAAIEASPAAVALVAAKDLPGGALPDPAARVSYDGPGEDFDALLRVGRCVARAGLLLTGPGRADVGITVPPDAADAARQLFEAEFVLGMRLFDGRVRPAEAVAGLAMAREAAAGLRDLAGRAGDARRAAVLATFDRSAAALERQRIRPVWDAVGAFDNTVIADHTGDAYALAGRNVRERMWRVEAVLALGRHRYAADRPADRLAVPRRLNELEAGETDPVVLAAVHAAKTLTIEQFRTVR